MSELTKDGLTLDDQQTILNALVSAFKAIYGDDINVEQNSPDGQQLNIYAQAQTDAQELLASIYNSFDPDVASGRSLDARCAINNVFRKGGTFTIQPIQIVVDRALTLKGLDDDQNNEEGRGFTISDASGNKFILFSTTTFSAAGTYTANFRAQNRGKVETFPNTITNIDTITLGVVSVNNPSTALTVGVDEESDEELRYRRENSLANLGAGYVDNLRSALLGINEVYDAKVYNNRTNQVDTDGIPAHGLWVIVEGGADSDIGNVMNQKITGGSPMKGAQVVYVRQADGSDEAYKFDRPTPETLYVNVKIKPIGEQAVVEQDIKNAIIKNFSYNIYETAKASDIACFVSSSQENISASAGVSKTAGNYDLIATPSSKDKLFVITADSITVTVEK
jgi:uncharacterized phage protein gp47/JayE